MHTVPRLFRYILISATKNNPNEKSPKNMPVNAKKFPEFRNQKCLKKLVMFNKISKLQYLSIFWESRDSISTVLCHSVPFKSPNEQDGATVEIESRDCRSRHERFLLCFGKRKTMNANLLKKSPLNHSIITNGTCALYVL